MNDQTTSQQAGFYLTRWAACVPLVAMLLPTVLLSINGILGTDKLT